MAEHGNELKPPHHPDMKYFRRQTLAIVGAILGMGVLIALAVGLAVTLRPTANPGLTLCGPPRKSPDEGRKIPEKEGKRDGASEKESHFQKYRKTAVESQNVVCSQIGVDMMLIRGGSAIDATVATVLCISTTTFQWSGLGGGLFLTVYDKERGGNTSTVNTLLARETMPAVGQKDYYTTHSSLFGGAAIGVPGIIHGLYTAWKMYGQLSWAELVAPAIKLAEGGFTVTTDMAYAIKQKKARLDKMDNYLKKAITKPDGTYITTGDIMKRPRLAVTLKRIAADPMSFYNGSLADDIIADIQEAGGEMVKEDLIKYRTRVRPPIKGQLKHLGLTMYSPEPPSSGVVVQYILRIIDGFGFNNSSLKDVPTAAATYHKLIEAFKFGFGRRSALADPLFWDISEAIGNLTDEDFITATRSKIDTRQTRDLDYYDHAYNIVDAGTSHFSVLSPNGGAVAVTSTVNYYFGSEVYGNRTGLMFNNEMDDFSIPGKPNLWNIAPSPSNFPAPGKMPMSSMSPTIFLNENEEVEYVTGAAGGPKIITSLIYVALHNLYLGLDLLSAMNTPRLHHQLLPNILKYEEGISQDLLRALQLFGHKTSLMPRMSAVGAIRNYCEACKLDKWCNEKCIHAITDTKKAGKPYGY